MRATISAILVFVFWLLLSGHFEPLLLVLGGISTLLTIYLSLRMNIIDQESIPVHHLARIMRYFVFLAKEIVLANLDVIKRILTPGVSISPQIIELPAKQSSDLGKVIYANSITLTPGTVSLDLTGNKLKVHALSKEAAEDLLTERIADNIPDDIGTV